MRCPKCGSEKSAVIDSRSDGDTTRRRRECQSCEFRFSTYERIEVTMPMVVKKDGRREAFDRDKVRGGLLKACEKRPVSMEIIDQTVEVIERKLQELYSREILSRKIGDVLMEELKRLDQIAYVRFASVYREFSDVSQFVDTLQSLTPKDLPISKS
ncbi:MAG: transcriptional repressor NrdR [Deltaproteobacteria bacterium]|nr:transcriptional repressor NrdR [Deltaproteobacteria bacterium]